MNIASNQEYSYQQRIHALRESKMAQTREKQALIGSMDHDDWAIVLPPADRRKFVETISGSGMPISDCLLEGFDIVSNHPSGGFFGPKACGRNFRALLERHPVYIDPMSSLAGAYMLNFMSYRKPHWNPDLDPKKVKPHLADLYEQYKLMPGIGAAQHFCQDLAIGLEAGWNTILTNIRHYREQNSAEKRDFYDGLEDVVLGIQHWIARHAEAAYKMAEQESNPQVRQNLLDIAAMNEKLIDEPPRSFREACQWMLWFQMISRMYNGSSSLGRLDLLLTPYYEREVSGKTLTEEEAIFHIACLLLRDTAYLQLGGPDGDGNDVTNRVSYLVLEAAHQLNIPANVGVAVGDNVDPGLLRRGVEIMFEDKTGMPKFLGVDRTAEGFAKNDYPIGLGYERIYAGCHWLGIPGREYTLNDCIKVNLVAIFDYALNEMVDDTAVATDITELWKRFEFHVQQAIQAIGEGLDFHMEHMHEVFPELVMDLLCHGPIEKGLDASNGGVEFYHFGLDGAGLAVVADSFAALDQRIEQEKRMGWDEIMSHLKANWAGGEGKRTRLMMHSVARYGSGNSLADEYAVRIARTFSERVKNTPTPKGVALLPALFSWANTIPMGKGVGATPNGRYAGEPISHGSNPEPGFRKDGAPSAMAVAIASVQPGYGNTAPMQIELDPGFSGDEGGLDYVSTLIKTHFDLGGTQINMNIMDAAKVLEAHKHPEKYPDLVVRVTGFSAYFASLSQEFRQLVVDRLIAEKAG